MDPNQVTVSVPTMPASEWPGMLQMIEYEPAAAVNVRLAVPAGSRIPESTPSSSTMRLCAVPSSFVTSRVISPADADMESGRKTKAPNPTETEEPPPEEELLELLSLDEGLLALLSLLPQATEPSARAMIPMKMVNRRIRYRLPIPSPV
jgi:hypothetical protein